MTGKKVVMLILVGISLTVVLLFSPKKEQQQRHQPQQQQQQPKRPHIIFILADDLGWNDVSWHNPQVLTPHLEELARGGVLLNQSYVHRVCTPTRAALLTGRYPFTLGRQHKVLKSLMPTGLTIKRKLLPQALQDAGYATHMVGKWHLGFCSWEYTPTRRGFDTFRGFYTGCEDYYHHSRFGGRTILTYDFWNNTEIDYSVDGEYSTYVFTSYIKNLLERRSPNDPMFLYLPLQQVHDPLQVPENYTKPFAHIKNMKRRIKLGMILSMDEAVGRVVEALKSSGHYENSIIVFTSDNGGTLQAAGNNWPLRGYKGGIWEGGTRSPTFVHSPLLPQKGIVSNKLIHVTDWFSTLVGLGGGDIPKDTHGYDQWEAITTSEPSPRKEMVYNIDFTKYARVAVRTGEFKLIMGSPGDATSISPPESIQKHIEDGLFTKNKKKYKYKARVADFGIKLNQYAHLGVFLKKGTIIRLYNVIDDPIEGNDIALKKPDVVRTLLEFLDHHMKDYVPADVTPWHPSSDPIFMNNTWSPGWCKAK